MLARRSWFWLGGFNWWAISAIVLAASAAVLAYAGTPLRQVLAVGVVALVLSILSPKEPQ